MERRIALPAPAKQVHRCKRLAIICPACGHRVCDISPHSKIEPFLENDDEKPPWDAEVYVRCPGCKTELALYHLTE